MFASVFPDDRSAGETALKTMGEAVQTYSALFGDYPHPSLTLVEANFFDGMEYDGLVFLDQNYFKNYAGGAEAYLVTLSAHETAHQWWYGLVGNDQAMEPWLDETLCTYSELLFYERQYPGEVNWWWNYRVNRFDPKGWVNTTIFDYAAFRPYVNAVYLRGAQFMQALRTQIGDPVFLAFLKDYAARYRQGWVSGADFFNVLGDHTQLESGSFNRRIFQKALICSKITYIYEEFMALPLAGKVVPPHSVKLSLSYKVIWGLAGLRSPITATANGCWPLLPAFGG